MIVSIQLCVTRLMELGLDEEGLFRLSAGQAKVCIQLVTMLNKYEL